MWLGACTSTIGTWMQILAQSWLVYSLSNSSLYLGLDAFFGQIPIFMFSLFGGVFADRKSRQSLLVMSQVIQLSCAFILAGLVALGVVRVWHIWCLSFTVGVAQSFGGPAYLALIPTLVEKEDLQNAIALNSIQFNLARVVGPALGGIALVKLGAQWCFTLNGISYLAVIFTLLMIHPRFVPEKTGESVLQSMRQGITFLRQREGMAALVALAFLSTLLSFPLITFLPVMAREVFHAGSNTFTLFLCLSGAGSVTGALFVAAAQAHAGQAKRSLLVMVILGIIMAGFGLSRNLILSTTLVFGAGAALMIVFALNSSLVQLYVSDAMRGRVMSVYNVAFRGGMPLGSVISGFLIKQTSVRVIMAGNGLLLVVLALYFLLVQRKLSKL
ncbi:MAG: MFS transporter [Acidobacteriaceae bacterium]|nr:MFS transporter [Acidobacteriaceae bacterium]MBV9297318.1 MFS transporter [Acidobacteriaceae bacterium]